MIVQTDPRRPSVVLVGPPGAGKSTIGRKLARELGVDLYDTDAGIEQDAGRSIPEIFAADGEPEFRRMEERVVRRAILEHKGVVSLGGGAVLSAATRELLRGRTVVYLEISVAEGLRRTGASTNRPLLAGDDPGAKYRALMRERRPLYREVASIRVRTDGRSPGRVVRNILGKLGVEPVQPKPEPAPAAPADGEETGRRSRSRRRRRRGRGGKASNAAATESNSQTETNSAGAQQDSESPSTSVAPESNSATTDESAPKRRSRRSRRGGRRRSRSADTAESTDAERPAAPPQNSSGGDASKPRATARPSAASRADEGRPTGTGAAGATRTANRTRRSARRAAGAPGADRESDAAQAGSPSQGEPHSPPSDTATDSTRDSVATAPGIIGRGRTRRTATRTAGPPGTAHPSRAESEQQV
ncbi:shikimate kinase [Nocardia mexicana]|uniref:Shikimate kinase n=1 Tax=Nocardia mexicana TaxID=279262 RepID=A0A370H388_9NOCA|nr:shikimate kinase [Nocardia mexicana]